MTRLERIFLIVAAVGGAVAVVMLALWCTDVLAAECPVAGEPCKVLVLTPQEEQMLTKQGGILDSAAAGRYLELGNVATYFRMKIDKAPAGEVKAPGPAQDPVKPAN